MKRFNNKTVTASLLAIAIISLSISVIAVHGAYIVQSNRTDTNLVYVLTQSTSTQGAVITITTIATKNGAPAQGLSISFYRCDSNNFHVGSNSTALSTVLTDATGKAIYNDATTQPGMYHHISEYSAL